MIKEIDTNQFIGLTENDAKELAHKIGNPIRVTRKNKQDFVITCDFKTYRINIELENDIIYAAYLG